MVNFYVNLLDKCPFSDYTNICLFSDTRKEGINESNFEKSTGCSK